eukprot:6487591-Amphidinium_carterae.1
MPSPNRALKYYARIPNARTGKDEPRLSYSPLRCTALHAVFDVLWLSRSCASWCNRHHLARCLFCVG